MDDGGGEGEEKEAFCASGDTLAEFKGKVKYLSLLPSFQQHAGFQQGKSVPQCDRRLPGSHS